MKVKSKTNTMHELLVNKHASIDSPIGTRIFNQFGSRGIEYFEGFLIQYSIDGYVDITDIYDSVDDAIFDYKHLLIYLFKVGVAKVDLNKCRVIMTIPEVTKTLETAKELNLVDYLNNE